MKLKIGYALGIIQPQEAGLINVWYIPPELQNKNEV